MVKRQTVWLSTMMVLSLMLIGYYTMNNSGSPVSGQDTTGTAVTTGVTTPGDGSSTTTASTGGSKATSGSDTGSAQASSSDAAGQTSTDWFVTAATQQSQTMSQKMDNLTKVIENNNSSPAAIDDARKQLTQLSNLEGAIQNAHDAILAKGYKDCVLMPNSTGDHITVWVKADKLTNAQAVDIMNTVSDQVNISAANVEVHFKA